MCRSSHKIGHGNSIQIIIIRDIIWKDTIFFWCFVANKFNAICNEYFGYSFSLRSYKKGPFFLLYYVFFAVQSESEIRFLRSAVEPINTFFCFMLLFLMFFFWFVSLVRLGYFS